MNKTTRRNFFKLTGAAVAASSVALCRPAQNAGEAVKPGFELGMASYTFRKFNLEDTIRMTKRLGLTRIAFKSFHLPMDATQDEIKRVSSVVKEAGLELYGCGVVYMKDEQEVNQAFEYAKTAGMKVMIGVPNHELLDMVNQKVQQYDINLAIHNHGPGDKLYPSPESAYEKIKDMDPRMGLCLDIGHAMRIGIDPSEPAEKFKERLHDIHIKDVSAATAEGRTVEIGRGVIDIPKFLKTLIKIGYAGTTSLEYEKDENDPLPGAAESIGYLRGVLEMLNRA
ncbi:sugar phosphate isomerase/epimerase [candidate division KSB1 bacterium]|nr:sugar phosphate isomerase/epimerase [candidate division KSB1 bacterium]